MFDRDSHLIFEKYIRLCEAPVTEIETLGDWSSKSKNRYDEPSIKLLKNPDYISKLKNEFAKNVSFDFNLWFLKSKNASKYRELGIVQPLKLKDMIPDINLDKVLESSKSNNITIIFTNNVGSEKVHLSPWMIGHRIGHALFAQRYKNKNIENEWMLFGRELVNYFNAFFDFNFNKLEDFLYAYGFTKKRLLNILNNLGTFRSARLKKIIRPLEFIFECFAQYLNTGEVNFIEQKDRFAASDLAHIFESHINYILYKSQGHILLM